MSIPILCNTRFLYNVYIVKYAYLSKMVSRFFNLIEEGFPNSKITPNSKFSFFFTFKSFGIYFYIWSEIEGLALFS